MIPRYQRIVFYALSVAIILMAAFTIHGRQKAHERITASNDAMPDIEPADAQMESVTLDLANDADGSIITALRDAELPKDTSARARTLLNRLFNEYSLPDSAHPLTASQPVDDVFLFKPTASQTEVPSSAGLLAVVNLRGSFVDTHPSGEIVETLTIASIIGTLHANMPEIARIRFLVDGQPRETLAGHGDLARTYPAIDTSASMLQPVQPVENFHP